MIELRDITFSRQGNKLLEDFNLRLQPHEHCVVQGRNGSGKTILLELINGHLHPTHGQVYYSFIDSNLSWDERYHIRQQKIHYIPAHALQNVLASHPDFFYQQRYYTMGDADLPLVKDFFGDDLTKLDTLNFPESFDIKNLLELELTRLSNGQLKKILIIRHLLKNIPKVLLFDYPFEGLDRESRKALADFIDHLATTFNIQIILTDQHHELPTVINRRLVLDDFKIKTSETLSPKDFSDEKKVISSVTQLTNTSPVVEMKNLCIQYGEKKIISNLNWKINKGERWALTGRNGSGKTTLFSLIYADHPMAYSQEVYLFGKRRGTGESIWDIKKRISYLGPEQMHFLNVKNILVTGREYILSTHKKNKQHLEELVDFFNASYFIGKAVRHYSSGELQLMLLMYFFMEDKELLLLDEPFQFLDRETKEKVNLYLGAHLNKDITMVLITHYEADIEKWTQLRMHL